MQWPNEENDQMLHENILECIGKIPLVRLQRLFAAKYPTFRFWGKCEFLNPGGSIKDRIGYNMVMKAEADGRIRPGDTLIEPTSGNTGIGIALAGAVKGYHVIIVMPEKMSREKQVILEALGAEIIRTPTEAAWDSPESHISVSKRLAASMPRAHILDQYSNPANPGAHSEGTALEIIADLGKVPDVVVIGAGTGGTLSGIASVFKAKRPDCVVVAADPEGSILAGPGPINSYLVEGIGYDFIPDVLDRSLVDRWVKTNDARSFALARQLIRQEGMLGGGSCGSALMAVEESLPSLKLAPGADVVVILPDGVRNYMTKFVDNNWLEGHGFGAAIPKTVTKVT
jgi:cystathionine beta-synthase